MRKKSILMSAFENQNLSYLKDFWSLVSRTFEAGIIKNLILEEDSYENVFHIAVNNKNPEVFAFLLSESKKLLTQQELADLLFFRDRNVLFELDDEENFEIIFEAIEDAFGKTEMKRLMKEPQEDNRTFLFQAASSDSRNSPKILVKFCNILEKYFDRDEIAEMLFRQTESEGNVKFHGCCRSGKRFNSFLGFY